MARQLNDAISRLDARLLQISNPAPTRQAQMQDKQRQTEMVERAAAQVYRPSPPLSPASLDFAIAEIAARQNELDGPPPRQMPPRTPADGTRRADAAIPPPIPQPAMQAAPAGPDFSSLERHLLKITSQIESLQRPDHVEQSIAAFRSELSEIRLAITEAMPRRAIESIETKYARCPAASRTPARAAPTPRCWPASSARWAKSTKPCGREVCRTTRRL